MNNKKLIFTSLLTVIAIVILIVVFRLNESEKEIGYEVAKSEAKVLEIENTKITGISHNTTKNNVSTKIKNKSNKILKNISINYVELDENQNKISTKQVPVEISLKRDEKALIKIIPQNYTYTIDIIGYSYETEDYNVNVDLNENTANIEKLSNLEEKQKELEDMLKYDILEIYDFKGIDDTSYKVKIKNNSQKNLGNIILKVAEKNSDGEYISVSNISNNSTLKAKDFSALMLNSTDKENTLEIIGYTYDDIENKSNIDIDLKTNTASIVRNNTQTNQASIIFIEA